MGFSPQGDKVASPPHSAMLENSRPGLSDGKPLEGAAMDRLQPAMTTVESPMLGGSMGGATGDNRSRIPGAKWMSHMYGFMVTRHELHSKELNIIAPTST